MPLSARTRVFICTTLTVRERRVLCLALGHPVDLTVPDGLVQSSLITYAMSPVACRYTGPLRGMAVYTRPMKPANSSMNFLQNSRVLSGAMVPFSSIIPRSNWM